jgi:serine/threonine protein kinase
MTATALPSEPPLPRSIGRYTLFDKIGRGGMADIFLARAESDLGASRLLVIKQILPHLAASREFSELLITEAKLAARLDHANIVQVHDLGRADGHLYIAMQYVEGFDLTELLRRCSRTKTALPVQYSLLVIGEVLRGLDYAHRRETDDGKPLGIVHRDVSPSNVLISFEGEVKLCDFGIARANDVIDTVSDDAIRGKAGYMSPEQAKGNALDARADVFAIGIVLWELMAGRRLYKLGAEPGVTLLEQARAAHIPDLPTRGLPNEEELFAIVGKALAQNPDERYTSAQAMLRDLERYVARSKLIASPIRFGEWLTERFGEEIIQQRRARERAVKALEQGPLSVVEAIEPPPASGVPISISSDPPPSANPSAPDDREGVPPAEAPASARAPSVPSVPGSSREMFKTVRDESQSMPWLIILAIVFVVIGLAIYFSGQR